MTKQGVKGKYQRTLNEKYEMYLNSVRISIHTHTHIKPSPQIITKFMQYIIWTWVRQLQFTVIHLVHKQHGCIYHTNAIRTGLRITMVHI